MARAAPLQNECPFWIQVSFPGSRWQLQDPVGDLYSESDGQAFRGKNGGTDEVRCNEITSAAFLPADFQGSEMYQPFDLSGRRVLITGGNGGIGYGMAEALLQSGAEVAIWGSRQEKTDRAVEQLSAHGRIVGFVCDIGDEQAVDIAFADTVQALGGLDGCFANAGVSANPVRLTDMTSEEFHRIQRINVNGVFYTLRAASRRMIADQTPGSLVVTSSTAAIEGAAHNSHYGASKGAVTSYVRALAVELARHLIRVNSILPGWIETEMTQEAMNNERFATSVLPRIPARRWGRIQDFGGIAVYLMSDASSYTTGEQFVIDGGYTKF